jgi:hypothetical protein
MHLPKGKPVKLSIKPRVAVAAVAATALVAAAAPAAANAVAQPNPQPNGSPYGVYILDPDTGMNQGTAPIAWDRGVSLSPVADDSTFDNTNAFPIPADATELDFFLSAPGNERDRSQWIGYSYQGEVGTKTTDWLETNALANLLDGDAPGNVTDVKANGGTFSFGIAYRNTSGLQPASVTGYFTNIHVTAGTGAWTYDAATTSTPATAPAVTTQPADTTVSVGASATFTAAASGSPAPTVKWQSSTNGTTWTDVSGATSATLTVANTTLAQSGTKYHAVFTNTAGSATSDAATLTVSPAAPTAPTKPVAGDPNQVAIDAPTQGQTSVVVPAGAANANKTLTAWAWSDPTNLGQVTTDASGNATVDISGLAAGQHTIALAESDFSVVAWDDITVQQGANQSHTQLTADVSTSNKFELRGVATNVDLGTTRRGTTTAPVSLGAFTVIDDRDLLPGWSLTADVTDFTNASASGDVVSKSALGLAPKKVGAAITGITTGSAQTAGSGVYSSLFAEGAANSTTLEAGTQFDADLTFAAPATAKKGTYTSTLTLTLTSK